MADRMSGITAAARAKPRRSQAPRIHTTFEDGKRVYLPNAPIVAGGEPGGYVLERHRTVPQAMRPHDFDEHLLMLSMSELAVPFSSRLNGRQINGAFTPGRLRFLSVGDSLATSWNQPHESILIALHPNVLRRALGEELCSAPSQLTSNIVPHDDPTLAHLALALESHLVSGRRAGRLFEQSLLAAIAARLWYAYGSVKKAYPHSAPMTKWKRKQIEEYVRENLGRDIHLQDIATCVNLSPYHLSRTFKATTGQGLYQFVLECRVRKAMQMIRTESPPSLARIARCCGFESYSQFVSAFRKIVGVLPSEYRTAHGG